MNNTESFRSRLKHAWNAFFNRAPTEEYDYGDLGSVYFTRPDRPRLSRGNERSIVTSVINRIAIDCAAIDVIHCKLDENNRYLETINSGLNYCFSDRANIDQTGRAFMQDAVMSLLDEGCITILPVDTTDDPRQTLSYDIKTMRVGKVTDWYPRHVRIEAYDDRTGERKKVLVPKESVAIVENPLYAVMNEPNSTMQRLIRKLNLLDAVDEQSGSGKLDLIVQLPYIIKSEARRKQAEQRRKDIEQQLAGSKYGIAYTDGTERVTQLNRPVENNLLKQVEYLTNMLFSQLGITQAILDGTAKEEEKLNYYNSTVEPILSAIVDAMRTTFLTRTARSQRQSIEFFRDPFRLVPVSQIAEIADKMTRNEIMTSNEIRQIVGMKPANDSKADQLVNSNINQSSKDANSESFQDSESVLDDLDGQIDELEDLLEHDDLNDEALLHYSSPYYDPVKAHEYYEAHKHLKGRQSTSGLNDEGKAAAKYVKERLTNERKDKVQSDKDETQSNIERHSNQMRSAIERLRNRLKHMPKSQKQAKQAEIRNEIAKLREANAAQRQSLREAHSAKRKQLNEEYDNKYYNELDRIKSEAAFQKQKKTKKGGNSK